ncbi:unnamed protein product [Orchesella dallaii]|uniref:G-protein coupled receptors family 1 profile domain-containing protein n=1 Tax=Orchesella dallaii TaxID=48710 RepID=A0ABP1RBJ5_9HEXA
MERCITIRWPFRYQITKRKAKKIMIAIWIWSCSVALPWVLYFDTYNADIEHPEMLFCVEKWPASYQKWSRYYFLVGNFMVCYVLPLSIIFLCYLTIWCRAYSNRSVVNESTQTTQSQSSMEIMHQKAKMSVTKTLLVIVLIFALSWLPLYCITLRMKFGAKPSSDFENEVISIIYPIAQWLGCSNSGINPVVYSFLNKNFRQGFYLICKCSDGSRGTSQQPPQPQVRVRQLVVPGNNMVLQKEMHKPVGRVASMLYDSY